MLLFVISSVVDTGEVEEGSLSRETRFSCLLMPSLPLLRAAALAGAGATVHGER